MASVSGKDVYFVFHKMPLALVFLYEHQYYEQNGINVRPAKWRNTLDDLIERM